MAKTFGERLVRSSPTEPADVKEAKRLVAELLNFCEGFVPDDDDTPAKREEQRLLVNAVTSFEEGCMWLVKGLTVPKD